MSCLTLVKGRLGRVTERLEMMADFQCQWTSDPIRRTKIKMILER
jgi:hypothetical protein